MPASAPAKREQNLSVDAFGFPLDDLADDLEE